MESFFQEYYQRTGYIYKALMEITHKCNLKCQHCYIDDRNKILEKNQLITIIDELYKEGILCITLTGGEVFSYPWFEEIYTYIKSLGFIVDIKTNALLLNENIKRVLKNFQPRKLDISVYGLSNDTYGSFSGDFNGFDKLTNSLDWLYENNFSFQLTVMAIRENYLDLLNGKYDSFFAKYNCNLEFEYDIIPNWGTDKNIKVGLLSPKEIVQLESNSKLYRAEIQNAKKNLDDLNLKCKGGLESIFVDVDGYIHICFMDSEKITLNDFVQNKDLLVSRNSYIKKLYQTSECSSCHHHIGCKRCPLRRNLTKRNNSNLWQCQLAELRKQISS